MLKLLFFSLLLGFSSVSGNYTFRQDYKYYEDVNGWIKLHRIPANWQDARLRCRAEGASLLSPSKSSHRDIMTSVMIAESADPCRGIYSGIHSTMSNGSYTTIEGLPVSSVAASWATSQPDNVYTEHCVVFHMNGTLEDVQCSHAYEYICYKKFEALEISKCGTVDSEYKWDGRTGHCYKFHRFGQIWSRAHMTCTAEGGYLAIINSDTEAQVLADLFATYPKDKIFAVENEWAYTGFFEWSDERSWFTVHGQTLQEAGYDKWADGEPNDYISRGETQDCGCIRRNGLLDDIWCHQPLSFICEKDPSSSQY